MWAFLRNPEIKRDYFVFVTVGICSFIYFYIFQNSAFIPYAIIYVFILIYHFAMSYFRFRDIAVLNCHIDDILHNRNISLLQNIKEGELSILHHEINKMLVKIREQNAELSKEKTYLADSLADLSHQLKTPLTSMNLIINMLESPDILPEKRFEYVFNLKRLTLKLQWLIDYLLKISKLDSDSVVFESQTCNIHRLVSEALVPIEVSLDIKNITTTINIEETASLSGDFKWLTEALLNILKNCMEHTPENGSINIYGKENSLFSEIIIEDSGSGFQADELPHIFERFYKGKNSSSDNVGIGLALSKIIISKFDGRILVKNKADGGACFTIRFYKSTI